MVIMPTSSIGSCEVTLCFLCAVDDSTTNMFGEFGDGSKNVSSKVNNGTLQGHELTLRDVSHGQGSKRCDFLENDSNTNIIFFSKRIFDFYRIFSNWVFYPIEIYFAHKKPQKEIKKSCFSITKIETCYFASILAEVQYLLCLFLLFASIFLEIK